MTHAPRRYRGGIGVDPTYSNHASSWEARERSMVRDQGRVGGSVQSARDEAGPVSRGPGPGKRTLTEAQPLDAPPTVAMAPDGVDDGGPAPAPTPGPAPTPAPTPSPTPSGTPSGPGTAVAASFNATRIAHPSAPAFGEVSWNAHEPTATYATYRDGTNWRFRLETLALRVPVGIASGGRTNVPSAAAAVVTASTWRTVASDLTPSGATPNRSPRTTYWAEDLTHRRGAAATSGAARRSVPAIR